MPRPGRRFAIEKSKTTNKEEETRDKRSYKRRVLRGQEKEDFCLSSVTDSGKLFLQMKKKSLRREKKKIFRKPGNPTFREKKRMFSWGKKSTYPQYQKREGEKAGCRGGGRKKAAKPPVEGKKLLFVSGTKGEKGRADAKKERRASAPGEKGRAGRRPGFTAGLWPACG